MLKGNFTTKTSTSLTTENIEQVLEQFRGDIQQVPPMYSALKREGRPLYELARQGIEIEREARPVTIYELHFSFTEDSLTLDVTCSKGTYIRVLGRILVRLWAVADI
jgi:tRNA pseudouridine55 synthase